MSAKPDQMQRLFGQIDAGNVSVKELPNALRQAGGPLMAIVAAVREMAAGGGGGAAWGDITGTLSAQTDLQTALDAKAGQGANTFTALQTITQASTNAGILASTGYSLTGSNATSMVDLAGTWNTSGIPSAIKLRITDTASNAASLLMDLGTATAGAIYSFKKTGQLVIADAANETTCSIRASANDTGICLFNAHLYIRSNGSHICQVGDGFEVAKGRGLGFTNTTIAGGALTSFFTGPSDATILMGADSATPIAQKFGACNGIGSNIAGADFSILASNGTGTGGSGNIVFKTAPASGSSSTPNTLAAILTIKGTGVLNVANIPTSAAGLVTGDVWSNLGILTVV